MLKLINNESIKNKLIINRRGKGCILRFNHKNGLEYSKCLLKKELKSDNSQKNLINKFIETF